MPGDFSDEFTDARLGDARRSRRLPRLAAALAQAPGASIAAATGGWAETMAAYRLLNCDDFQPADLLAPHHAAIERRCREQACVVVAQDTSELDFTRMAATEGLGPLNDDYRRGFLLHSLYAVSEQGLPLGVWDATILCRDDETFRGASQRRKRPVEEKESWRWVEGYLRSSELARRLPDCEVVSVSDRDGDLFEAFEAWQQLPHEARAEWIIRANQDRALEGIAGEDAPKLFAALEQAPELGGLVFEVPAGQGTRKVRGSRVKVTRSARRVRQVVRAMPVTPRPPYRRGRQLAPVTFWAVLAEEVDAPAGEQPIRWLLLTSMQAGTLEQACRVLRLYMRRWDIEVFHRVLKTGCRVERLQLKTRPALVNALMIYLVIAWRILYMTHLGRRCPDLPCGCVFEEAEWKSACAVVRRDPAAGEPSLSEFIAIVGKLGGHLGRKSDGPPGPQPIWRGLARVRDFACAWLAFQGRES